MHQERHQGERHRRHRLQLRDPRHRLDVRGVEREHAAPEQSGALGDAGCQEQNDQERGVQRVEQDIRQVVARDRVLEDLTLQRVEQQVDGSVVCGERVRVSERRDQPADARGVERPGERALRDVGPIVGDELAVEGRRVDHEAEARERQEERERPRGRPSRRQLVHGDRG